jgi:signal transduction histidine kinase
VAKLPYRSADPRGARARALRLAGDRPFAAFVVVWTAVLAPYLVYVAGGSLPLEYRDSVSFALLALAVAAIALVDLSSVREPAERRLRLLVAVAFVVWAVEELLELRFTSATFYVLHDGLFVLFYLLLGFVAFAGTGRGEAREPAELRRLARYETAMFAIGMFFYFVIIPIRLTPGGESRGLTSATLYLTLDGFLVGLFGWRLRRATRGRDALRWRRMAVGALLFLASDALFFAAQRTAFDLDRLPWLDLVWYLPQLWIAAAVRTPATGSRSSGLQSPLEQEGPALRFAPAFLYAALVPAIHLLSELLSADAPSPVMRTQGIFALALALLLGILAAVHQRRISRLQGALRGELLASRRQLAAAMKLEAIGRLAAGVAHDFNNLLTVVVGRTDLMLAKSEIPEQRENLEMVLRAARRAADLTSELLAVGQRQIGFRSRVEMVSLVRGLRAELESLCGPRIELELRLGEEPLEIAIDPLHLERIVRNLVANARDAMPEGGLLLIAADGVAVSGGDASGDGDDAPAAGRYAELAFRDDGVGMDADTQRRLFEPFFTTKAMGRGTGLGLASVYGLVRQNDGRIRVESSPGAGTTIRVAFPLLVERGGPPLPADPAADAATPPAGRARG